MNHCCVIFMQCLQADGHFDFDLILKMSFVHECYFQWLDTHTSKFMATTVMMTFPFFLTIIQIVLFWLQNIFMSKLNLCKVFRVSNFQHWDSYLPTFATCCFLFRIMLNWVENNRTSIVYSCFEGILKGPSKFCALCTERLQLFSDCESARRRFWSQNTRSHASTERQSWCMHELFRKLCFQE